MACSRMATSRTRRAIGPAWSRFQLSGSTPRTLIRPYVGLSPTTPHNDDGIRIEPPVSLPSEPMHNSAASAAADPPDEPPGTRVTSHGLRQAPKCGLSLVTP